jgi:hypothetical protein
LPFKAAGSACLLSHFNDGSSILALAGTLPVMTS